MNENYHKCDEKLGFCPTLRDRISDGNGKGIKAFHIAWIPANTEKISLEDLLKLAGAYYKTDAKDKGVMFKFCPFCGERIDWYKTLSNPNTPEAHS